MRWSYIDGTLKKFNVELIGASVTAINTAEDRQAFREAMEEIGLNSARSTVVHSLEKATDVAKKLGFLSSLGLLSLLAEAGWNSF